MEIQTFDKLRHDMNLILKNLQIITTTENCMQGKKEAKYCLNLFLLHCDNMMQYSSLKMNDEKERVYKGEYMHFLRYQ